jgi:glycosyltransferase involved in cell wall biosynthesis
MIFFNKQLDLTIAIPVKNDAYALDECLGAIGTDFAKVVVVLDSGSSDDTNNIVTKHGAELINFNWNGEYPKKRNWFLINHKPNTKWILFLDADEILTKEFKVTLRKKIENIHNNLVGYWLTYSIYFMGKPMKGGYPLNKLALFKVGSGLYEKIDENYWSSLDMEIHEHPVLNGEIGLIKTKIDHFDYRSIYHYVNKHNEYAKWEAHRFLREISNFKNQHSFTWKQKFKYKLIQTPYLGIIYFFGAYVFMGGFLDGFRGFIMAVFKMSYFFQVYINIKELKNNRTL